MEIEKLDDLIPDNEDKTMGDLYKKLLAMGYEDNYAQKIIQKHISYYSHKELSDMTFSDPVMHKKYLE